VQVEHHAERGASGGASGGGGRLESPRCVVSNGWSGLCVSPIVSGSWIALLLATRSSIFAARDSARLASLCYRWHLISSERKD